MTGLNPHNNWQKDYSDITTSWLEWVKYALPEVGGIINDISAEYKVSTDELMGRVSKRRISRARQEAMQRIREIKGPDGSQHYSLEEIGRIFGRNHSAVSYACKKALEARG